MIFRWLSQTVRLVHRIVEICTLDTRLALASLLFLSDMSYAQLAERTPYQWPQQVGECMLVSSIHAPGTVHHDVCFEKRIVKLDGFSTAVVILSKRATPYRIARANLERTAIILGGGPGQGGMLHAQSLLFWAEELQAQDRYGQFILYDVPGSPLVSPYPFDNESCRAITANYLKELENKHLSRHALASELALLSACFEAFLRDDANTVYNFTTVSQALWLEQLLLGLGMQQVSLVGISYGTRLADVADRVFTKVFIEERILDGYYPFDRKVQADDPRTLMQTDQLVFEAFNRVREDNGDLPSSYIDYQRLVAELINLEVALHWINEEHVYSDKKLLLGSTLFTLVQGQVAYDSSSWWELGNLLYKSEIILEESYSVSDKQSLLAKLWRHAVSNQIQFVIDEDFSTALFYLTECQDRFASDVPGSAKLANKTASDTTAACNTANELPAGIRHRAPCSEQAAIDTIRSSRNTQAYAFIQERFPGLTTEDFQIPPVCTRLAQLGLLYSFSRSEGRHVLPQSTKTSIARSTSSPKIVFSGREDLATPYTWTQSAQQKQSFLSIVANDTAHSVIYHGTCDDHWSAYLYRQRVNSKQTAGLPMVQTTVECNKAAFFSP